MEEKNTMPAGTLSRALDDIQQLFKSRGFNDFTLQVTLYPHSIDSAPAHGNESQTIDDVTVEKCRKRIRGGEMSVMIIQGSAKTPK